MTPASTVPVNRAPGLAGSLLAGVVVALVVAVLPALRHPDKFLGLWLACAGSGALVLGPAWFGARTLLPDWRSLAPLVCGLGISLGPVMVLGRLIKTATHHRPLGAMTYAVVACAAVLCAWVLAWRLVQLGQAPRKTIARVARAVLGALVSASLALAAVSAVGVGPAVGPVLVDGAALVALLVLGLKLGLDLKLGAIPPALAWVLWGLAVGAGGLMSLKLGALAATASLPLSAVAALFVP